MRTRMLLGAGSTALSFASLFMAARLGAQTSAPTGADSPDPLELKPGCWQMRHHASASGIMKPATSPEAMQWVDFQEKLIGRKLSEPERNKVAADYIATHQQAATTLEKGGDRTEMSCYPSAYVRGIFATDALSQCARTVTASGRNLHLHIACPVKDGQQVTLDFARISSGEFKGTRGGGENIGGVDPSRGTYTIAETFAGKWISDMAPHMPTSPPTTDLDGVRPKGPLAVARLDRFRIVAIIAEKRITAMQAYMYLGSVSKGTLAEYGPRLPGQLQQIVMRQRIASEAVKLRLHLQEPWKSRLAAAVKTANGNPGTMQEMGTADMGKFIEVPDPEARIGILWEAYFSRAATDAEKQTMLQEARSTYSITVTDPDFFNGETRP